VRISPKSDNATQRKALERENGLLRKLASRLEHTIDAMRVAASGRTQPDPRNKKSAAPTRSNREPSVDAKLKSTP
jgi:hypothetical protein